MNLGSQLFNKQTLPMGLPVLARAAPWVLVHCYSAPPREALRVPTLGHQTGGTGKVNIVLPQIGQSCVGLERGSCQGPGVELEGELFCAAQDGLQWSAFYPAQNIKYETSCPSLQTDCRNRVIQEIRQAKPT